MLVDIEKIIVSDRIRKDFGNIGELANDIQENGLINPPVVTPNMQLIAGERRLRACQKLGYQQIEVRVMTVKDYEHQLRLEISENENRKEFTFSERVEWARRLEQVEALKAKERLATSTGGVAPQPVQNFAEGETGKTRDKVAANAGFGSGETYRKAKFIADNADSGTIQRLDAKESTIHKEYEQLKAQFNKATQELEQVKQERDKALKRVNQPPETRIETKTVEVVPETVKQELARLTAELEKAPKANDVRVVEKVPDELSEKLQQLELDKTVAESTIQDRERVIADYQSRIKELEAVEQELQMLKNKQKDARQEEKRGKALGLQELKGRMELVPMTFASRVVSFIQDTAEILALAAQIHQINPNGAAMIEKAVENAERHLSQIREAVQNAQSGPITLEGEIRYVE